MKETQLLKGVLEGCVLDMIGQKSDMDMSWFKLCERLDLTLSLGTIYPLLQKLEKING